MSDNPLADMVNNVNRIVTPHLEGISRNINEKLDRRLRRKELEEKVIVDHARLRLQEENYEAGLQNKARQISLYEQKANADLDLDRRKQEAAAYEDLHKVTSDQLSALEARRVVAELDGADTAAIDAEVSSLKARQSELQQRMMGTVMPTQQDRIVPKEPGQQLNIQLPQRTNDQLGFSGYDESSFQRDTQSVKIKGLQVSPEEREMMIRVTAAEVGKQTDLDGATMMAETIRNRALHKGASISSLITPRYYETMREGSDTYSTVDPESEAYQKAALAVDNALAGSNLSDSALNNYYAPQWTESAQKRNDFHSGTEYQGEIFYKKTFEKDFDFNNYIETDADTSQDVNAQEAESNGLPAGGGIAAGGSGLFPGDYDYMPVAEPVPDAQKFVGPAGYAPEEAPDDTAYSFDDEAPLILDDEKATGGSMLEVASVPQNGLIINDNQTMNGQVSSPTGSPEPVRKKLTDQEAMKTYAGIVRISDPKLREQTLSVVSNKIREANPDVFDERVKSIAQEFVETGSRVDFEKAIPEEVVALVGKDRAIGIFQEMSTQYKVEQRRTKDFEEKSTRLKTVEKDLDDAELNLIRAQSKRGSEYLEPEVQKYQAIVDRYKQERDRISGELDGLQPAKPAEQAQLPDEPVKELPEASKTLIERTKSASPTELPTTEAKPVSSLIDTVSKSFGIRQEFLNENQLPSEPFGLFEKIFNGGDIESAVSHAVKAYVQTEKARYQDPKYTEKQTDFLAVKEFLSDKSNLEQVLALAANLGYSVEVANNQGRSKSEFKFTNSPGESRADPKHLEYLNNSLNALLSSPSDAVALVKTSLKKDLRSSVRDAIVREADNIAISKKSSAVKILQNSSIQNDL